MLAFCSRPCSHQEFSEKIVKVCLHSSKAVQISLQFNELFEKKFKILTSEIFTINFQKTVLQKVSLPNLSSPNILPRLIALPKSQKKYFCFLTQIFGDLCIHLSFPDSVLLSLKSYNGVKKKRLWGRKNEEASNNGGPREGRLLHTLFVYGCGCLFQCGFGLLDSPGLHAGQAGD